MTPTSIRHIAWALTLGSLLAAAPAAAQPAPPLDQFLCLRAAPTRQADRALRFTPRKGVGLRDRLGDVKVDVKKPVGLCVPTDAPDVPLADAATHLEDYAARLTRTRPAQPRVLAGTHRVTNRFGTEDFAVKTLNGVLVPTAAAFDAPPDALSNLGAVDHFSCYAAGRATGLRSRPASAVPLPYETALGTLLIDVRAPVQVCVPAEVDGQSPGAATHVPALACYRAKLARTKPPQANPFPRRVATVNRFGSEALTVNGTLELCVPSAVSASNAAPTPTRTFGPTPTPTLTPPPDFSLRVEPASVTVTIGDSTRFTATAVFKNGSTQDFTERVQWISSTEVAVAPNEAGDRNRIDTVDGGSSVISALDEATGVNSNDTNESALLTVTATLERIELLPIEATRGKGESIRLRATGHFTGGFTRDIADRLNYFSTAPGIANPTNGPTQALQSRVVAVGVGAATISAVEPIGGLTSTETDDDVTITVVPPLERCAILPILGTRYEVGAEEQLTARGYYPGGFERNLTQQVVWTSSAPDVMEATNRDGDRSRIIAVGGGEARISATDSITGRACEGQTWVAVGVPTGIYLTYDGPFGSGRPIRAGKTRRLAVFEFFNPGYFRKRITEQVVFETSNPAILAAPNTPGDRGLVVGVGSGTASVIARDPATGRTTQPIYFRVLDGLTRVRAQEYGDLTKNVNVHEFIPVRPYGLFPDGWALLDWADVTVVSTNPAVASNPPPFTYFRGLAPGFATLHVIDNETGISSEASGESLRVGVRGALSRLSVIPATPQTERVGVPIAFGAIAHYVGGVSELATWQMTFSSSDPSVAVNGNDFWVRGQMIPIAGGTTVIHATDPLTGVSSADSGDGRTLTVLGPLQQLEITPSTATRSLGRSFAFTAIGRDAGGREMNLTQRVQWSSTNQQVAVARNVASNRSRIDSVGLGTTTIFASDPDSGLTSSDTGDDATFIVDGVLESLTLSAEVTQVPVDGVTRVTATGHLDDGTTVNLTQEVTYTSSDPTVAKAENTPGDRSRIVGLKAGTATISARNPGTGLETAPGGGVTLTVVP